LPVLRAAPVAVAAALPDRAAPRAPVPQTYETVAATGPSAGQIGCYSSAPVPEVVRLRNGGTAVVCTRGDGTLSGWRPPIYPAGSRVGAALSEPVQLASAGRQVQAGANYAAAANAVEEMPAIPAGYKAAWDDGRLNPQRGIGTAEGQMAQDQIWTRKVPAQLVADVAKKKARRKAGRVTVSSMNEAAAPAPAPRVAKAGGSYVQVGTFGVAANAAGAAQRLQALGLPVAKSKLHRGGKDLQIVMAGPFGSAAEAQAALGMARQAGFSDAILR
jgi:cell division septation protein DedD